MISNQDIQDLGWQIVYDRIVLVAEKGQLKLYFNKIDHFSIFREWNDGIEREQIYKGNLQTKKDLEILTDIL